MGSLFFGCPKSRTMKLDKQEQAIMDCKITRDKIKAYSKRLDKNEKTRKEKAKDALRNKDKDKARIFLMQAKLYREQVTVANGQLIMIEEQIIQIESAKLQKEAIVVLQQGNKILKELSEAVNIEQWEKIADDMNEVKQQQDEIGNFLKSRGMDQSEYDEAVDLELEKLMKLESITVDVSFPDAGKDKTKKEQIDEERTKIEA